MTKRIRIILICFLLFISIEKKVFSLDAETAHPWIAENAAKIWPFPGVFDIEECKKVSPEQACIEFSKTDMNLGGYLGKYDPDPNIKSGAFTDFCPSTIAFKEFSPGKACTKPRPQTLNFNRFC